MRHTRCLLFTAASLAAFSTVTTLPLVAADSDKDTMNKRSVSSGHLERLDRITGSQVLTSDREQVGRINNLVLDLETGRVLLAVVGTGTGNQRVALPPGVFADARGNSVYLKINRERFNSAPKIQGDLTRERVADAAFAHRVYQQFNQQAWWQGAADADKGKFNNVHAGERLIGMNVVNVQDKPVGEVENSVIDLPAGRILYVVVEPSRDLNLGDKLYAFPPNALTLHQNGKQLTVDTDKEKLSSGPSFDKDQWPALSDRSFAARVYQHYGKDAYFGASGLTPTGRDSDRSYEGDNNAGQNDSDDNRDFRD